MKLVIQRVTRAELWADGVFVGQMDSGLVVFTGVAKGDGTADADYLANKLIELRIFADAEGKLNRGAVEAAMAIMLVPNFTLYANTAKGKRPSFDRAAKPEEAKPLYEYFVKQVRNSGLTVITGIFQSHMRVTVENDGPITLICESK